VTELTLRNKRTGGEVSMVVVKSVKQTWDVWALGAMLYSTLGIWTETWEIMQAPVNALVALGVASR
jgi:hypothetical protein